MARKICPFWIGYFLLSPFRKLAQNPKKILSPFLEQGMKVLDFGSAMGFFSIPMAKMVEPNGKIICVDIQKKMLDVLRRRAKRRKVSDSIETCQIEQNTLNLEKYYNLIDFAFLFAVAHEVPDQDILFKELSKVLKQNGKLLFAEPEGHVSQTQFNASVSAAEKNNFIKGELLNIPRSHSVILEKP